jgi:hypothetical protein
MKQVLIIVLLLIPSHLMAKRGYDYTPVLIHLNKEKQDDTIGFNLVEHLPAIIHKRIMSGEVVLWGSPLKKIEISVSRLQQLEEESGTKFLENDDIFINEYWKLFRKKFEFHVAGFTFFNRSESGQRVSYGFIDADDIKSVLSTVIIPCNVNGNTNLCYWDAILSKRYYFDLVKFGKVDLIKNPEQSFLLKSQAFNCDKIKNNALILADKKEVSYTVLKSGGYSKNENFKIFEGLENFLMANRQEIFYLAPPGTFSHLNHKLVFTVDKIEISEMWTRNENGEIGTEMSSMTLTVNGVKLKTIEEKDLEAFDFLIQFKPFKEHIKNKSYEYIITQVNSQEIMGYQAEEVQSALHSDPWHLILFKKSK